MSDQRVPSMPPPAEQRPLSRAMNEPLPKPKPTNDRGALRMIVDLTAPRMFAEPLNPGDVVKQCRDIASWRLCNEDSATVAKIQMLEYLIGIAQSSDGSAIWRALFAEIRGKLMAELAIEDAG